jgi:hypothetical protein
MHDCNLHVMYHAIDEAKFEVKQGFPYPHPSPGKSDVGKDKSDEELGTVDEKEDKTGVFMDLSNGICMTFKYREVKRDFYRLCMRILLIVGVAALYVLFWPFCDTCILGVTVGSCATTCMGFGVLTSNCIAGIAATMYKGVRIGTEWASVDFHFVM